MLIIFEMANNHMGSLETGLRIIRECHEVSQKYPEFEYVMKFQYRDLPTYIHPSADPENKYVKRFRETDLSERDRITLRDYAAKLGFKTACTPFDEQSIRDMARQRYNILKVGSPSIADGPLLTEVLKWWRGTIIASVGGATVEEIDHVVNLFYGYDLTLLHCVSEYPTPLENLQLNQIDWLRARYPGVRVGLSSHEGEFMSDWTVGIAVAKGATVFERHVCTLPNPNGYSSTPKELVDWLSGIRAALKVCGGSGRIPGPKPTQFMRQEIDGRMWWKP